MTQELLTRARELSEKAKHSKDDEINFHVWCNGNVPALADALDIARTNVQALGERLAETTDELDAAMKENERLREALTPSEETKGAYIGEFKFKIERENDDGVPYMDDITVPWTTIKEIMATIRTRAALT